MSQSSNHNWFLEYENDSNCLYSHQIQIQLITFGNPVRYIYIYIYIYSCFILVFILRNIDIHWL